MVYTASGLVTRLGKYHHSAHVTFTYRTLPRSKSLIHARRQEKGKQAKCTGRMNEKNHFVHRGNRSAFRDSSVGYDVCKSKQMYPPDLNK